MKVLYKHNLKVPFYPLIFAMLLQQGQNDVVRNYGSNLLGIIFLFAVLKENSDKHNNNILNYVTYGLPGFFLVLWMAGFILSFI